MSEDEAAKQVRADVREMYENYGIDARSLGDDELVIVFDHYYKNRDSLEKDLKKSKVYSGKFDNDIL